MRAGCGNLQEKGTLPMDKETFTENVPSDAKGGCELEDKHEQSMLSVSQGYNLCRDDTDPCGFAEKCQKMCGSCTETSLPIPSPTTPHTPSPPVPVPAPLRLRRTSLLRVIRTCRVGQTTTDRKGMHRMSTGLRQAVERYGGAHDLLPGYRARRVPSTKWHACVRRQKSGNQILRNTLRK